MIYRTLFLLIVAASMSGCSGCSISWPPGGGLPSPGPRPFVPSVGMSYNCGASDNIFTVYMVQVGAPACDLGIPVLVRAPSIELARTCPTSQGVLGIAFAYPGFPSPPTERGVCRGAGLYSARVPISHHDSPRAVECVRQTDLASGGSGIGWSGC